MPEQVRVFVSHHHSPEENAFTTRLVNDLKAAGAAVWFDVADIRDRDFIERINAALASSDWLVLVVTPASLRSQPVGTEVNAALRLVWEGRMHGVIPLVAEQCEPTAIPPTWPNLQRYDATHDYQAALAGLLRALGLSAPASVHPAPVAPSPSSLAQTLPPLGPAPVPEDAEPADHLITVSLYNLGFRGYTVRGVECVLPPLCPVSGGVFTMGSDKAHDKDAYDNETPQYPVPVGDFAIGRHPVTVAEYAWAVRAKAVREPPYYEYRGKTTDWQTQLSRLDHPVVCVSWQEARAYARWLRQTTGGQFWLLPTEAEWEKMARWESQKGQARIYPWGETFDAARCNTFESGIGTTTPVGRYPTGTSPYKAQDVAGNVWEWTSSLVKPYAYNSTDGREGQKSPENRVLRGGSWGDDARHARTAVRSGDWPDSARDNYGFRLAWAPIPGWLIGRPFEDIAYVRAQTPSI